MNAKINPQQFGVTIVNKAFAMKIQLLCTKTFQLHKRVPFIQKSVKEVSLCPEHPKEELVDHCMQCSMYICTGNFILELNKTVCYKYNHRNHEVVPTEIYIENQKRSFLETWNNKTPTTLEQLQQNSEQTAQVLKDLELHYQQLQTEIDTTCKQLIDLIVQKQFSLKSELSKRMTSQLADLKTFGDHLQKKTVILDTENSIVQMAASSPTSVLEWSNLLLKAQATLRYLSR